MSADVQYHAHLKVTVMLNNAIELGEGVMLSSFRLKNRFKLQSS